MGRTSGSAPVSGRLLGYKSYAPSTLVTYALGTAVAALDATNLTVGFVAPASGSVLAVADIHGRIAPAKTVGNENWLMLGYVTHGTSTLTTALTRHRDTIDQITADPLLTSSMCHSAQYVTGLTPGTSYQWDLASAYGGSANPVYAVAYVLAAGTTADMGQALLTIFAI